VRDETILKTNPLKKSKERQVNLKETVKTSMKLIGVII
jgi:hypothetical protein